MSCTFSIVTAVYNVEKYLEECIESVIGQDYDLSKVQMILVDDGSTDGSGAICDSYAERYPQLVRAVHKKNGGVSSARNEGLRLAEGEYVNFLDPDDMLSGNSLKEAERFLLRHGEEVDMAAMPVYFFGARKGEHPLNYKFKKGSRVIDLAEELDAAQVHLNSAFTKRSALKDIRFDECLKWSEDEKVCLQALRRRQKLGVIAGASYHYRKRGGLGS